MLRSESWTRGSSAEFTSSSGTLICRNIGYHVKKNIILMWKKKCLSSEHNQFLHCEYNVHSSPSRSTLWASCGRGTSCKREIKKRVSINIVKWSSVRLQWGKSVKYFRSKPTRLHSNCVSTNLMTLSSICMRDVAVKSRLTSASSILKELSPNSLCLL